MSPANQGKPIWVAHFNISDATWEKLKSEALRQKASPLELAFAQKLIDDNTLLSFERQISKIPTLKAEFFNSSIPEKLFEKFSYEESRAHFCVPTTEWNGAVYWAKATSEPHPSETPQTKAHWFLAPCSAILKWLEAWKAKAQPAAFAPLPPQLQGAIELDMPEPVASNVQTSDEAYAPQSAQPQPTYQVIELPAPVAETAVEPFGTPVTPPVEALLAPLPAPPLDDIPQLEPLESSVPEVTLVEPTQVYSAPVATPPKNEAPPLPPDSSPNFDFSSLLQDMAPEQKATSAPQPAPAVTPQASPTLESVKLDDLFGDTLQTVQTETFQTQTSQTETQQTQTPSFIKPVSTTPPVPEPASPFVPLDLGEPLPLKVDNVPPAPAELQEPSLRGADVKMDAPIPVASNAEPKSSVSMSISFSQPGHIPKTIPLVTPDKFADNVEAAQNQDQLVDTFMGYWQNYFQQVMVLLLQQDHMVVWWHNQKFGADCKRGAPVSLEAPSVFQIVFKTAAPYHGYVTHSEINDAFFKMANAGKYPEHLSIVPIASEGKVIAMALGTCTSSTAKTLMLRKLEEDVALFSKNLFKLATGSRKAS